jgi:enoyl-[acyl-carrier protein] reductase I
MMLSHCRYLVTGVLTEDSIAWHVARALQLAGAEIALTGFGRCRRITEEAARSLPDPPEVLELDATNPDHFSQVAAHLQRRWGRLDGAVHAVAGAPPDALGGQFLSTPAHSAELAFRTSAYSFHALATSMAPLLQRAPGGGSVVGLDFDAALAWPGYDWMGVAKAALESVCRYLALYLGPAGTRVNLVAAGPIETVSGGGISTFPAIADRWERDAPLGWDRTVAEPVVGPVLFLLSDLAKGVTGEILHADGGMHVMGMGAGACVAALAGAHRGPASSVAGRLGNAGPPPGSAS